MAVGSPGMQSYIKSLYDIIIRTVSLSLSLWASPFFHQLKPNMSRCSVSHIWSQLVKKSECDTFGLSCSHTPTTFSEMSPCWFKTHRLKTQTHTHAHTDMHAHTRTHTNTHTQHAHTRTHTRTTHTRLHTQTNNCKYTPMQPLSVSCFDSLTNSAKARCRPTAHIWRKLGPSILSGFGVASITACEERTQAHSLRSVCV